MRKLIKIGQREFLFKKDAVAHYRAILNSYDCGESLSDSDFDDLVNLYNYNCFDETENLEENFGNETVNEKVVTDPDELMVDELLIEDIRVSRVQYNTKCFEVFFNDNTSCYISYLMLLNNQAYNPERKFNVACRNSIHSDIHSVKQEYFDNNSVKGQVKCQETGKLSKWEDLVVDHRQPHTFSIIVDRFKEVYKIDLAAVEYVINELNQIMFKDENLARDFVEYHKVKASLRIVRKECNSSRSGMARLKRSVKDLIIK